MLSKTIWVNYEKPFITDLATHSDTIVTLGELSIDLNKAADS